MRLSVNTATQWAHDCGIMCRGSFAKNRGVLVEVGGIFEHLAPNVFAPSRHLQVYKSCGGNVHSAIVETNNKSARVMFRV